MPYRRGKDRGVHARRYEHVERRERKHGFLERGWRRRDFGPAPLTQREPSEQAVDRVDVVVERPRPHVWDEPQSVIGGVEDRADRGERRFSALSGHPQAACSAR